MSLVGAQRNPSIHVVYLTRNALDKRVSNIRHHHSMNSKSKISAHCFAGDVECVKLHSQFNHDIILPTGGKLQNMLHHSENLERAVVNWLRELNISFVEVFYEKLYSAEDAEEWMRLFRYLGQGPSQNLTMDTVRAAFSMAPTHKKSRNETIINFKEAKKSLTGTRFEYLLVDP